MVLSGAHEDLDPGLLCVMNLVPGGAIVVALKS